MASSPFASPQIPQRKIQPQPHDSSIVGGPPIDRSSTAHLSVSYVDDAQLQLKSKIERRLVNLRRQHERVIGEAKRLKRVIATLEQEHEKLAPSQMCVIM